MFRTTYALALLATANCQEPRDIDASRGSTTPAYERVERSGAGESELQTPVRIGESGPGFPACATRGTARRSVAAEGDTLAVRAAPFEGAAEIAQLPASASFFVCARSIDQKWFGIVFDDAGTAAASCGLAAPALSRRPYAGPCRSGWVASVLVRTTAG